MPRIDPIQLLHCLGVLLSPDGGIKSTDEVQRLAHLMSKFSKKLVSKCIYVQILKRTEPDLLGLFMGSGGWRLLHIWLTESIVAKNWPLVRELLELLLLCPVDIERLKTNNCPKLVKELSKDGNHLAISALANKLVEQWLKTVKSELVLPVTMNEIPQIIRDAELELKIEPSMKSEDTAIKKESDETDSKSEVKDKIEHPSKTEISSVGQSCDINNFLQSNENKDSETLPILKITVKDGKQILSQVDENCKASEKISSKDKDKHRHKSREKNQDKSSNSPKSSRHSTSKSKSNEKEKYHKSSPSRHKDRSKEKQPSSSSKSKESHDSKRSSDKSKSSSKVRHEHTSKIQDKEKLKSEKDKTKDKSKDAEQKLDNYKADDKLSIQKLGKIPKLSDVKKEKHSISIEVRKPDEPKPKTVKTFNSKFRKHGLEEEIKPPPSRATILNKKNSPVLPPTLPIPKRPSPIHNDPPPEKKAKTVEHTEKPGSIKLIAPKPKPTMLLESDMFMDALNASTVKKEPKKRKRRTSGSKDGNTPSDSSPPHTPNSLSSPSRDKSVPPKFYQDTLNTEEDKIEKQIETESVDTKNNDTEKIEVEEPHTLTINGLKGVLCYHKRKGPKKSIRWKPDTELEEVQYFELDETERVNVTKTFTDMKYLERINEREAFQKARNLINDDVMEEKTVWRALLPIDSEGQVQVEYGKNSKEKDIQAIRQKGTLQALYFHKAMIPDSPHEPEPETHPYSEPSIIPLEDITGSQDNISDFRNVPWPEPKGNAPPTTNPMSVPVMFPSNISQFPTGFPNPQFPGVPSFQGPNIIQTDWQNGIPPMIPNGIPPNMPPNALPGGPIPPGLMVPENMMMDMFGAPNPMFSMPPEGFNMQQGMFPPDFNMAGPQGPPGPDVYPGPGNFRGAMRGRGALGHWRGKNPGNWDAPQRGRGANNRSVRKAVCIYFQRKGSCRQGDNCTFLHPGVNCPF